MELEKESLQEEDVILPWTCFVELTTSIVRYGWEDWTWQKQVLKGCSLWKAGAAKDLWCSIKTFSVCDAVLKRKDQCEVEKYDEKKEYIFFPHCVRNGLWEKETERLFEWVLVEK